MRIVTGYLVMTAYCFLMLSGCQSLQNNKPPLAFTLGTIQKELRIGISDIRVLEVLGSPNMVSTDSKHCEVWVYDKISTNTTATGGGVLVVNAGTSTTSQNTITLIIKFDKNKNVRDFSYHQSKF